MEKFRLNISDRQTNQGKLHFYLSWIIIFRPKIKMTYQSLLNISNYTLFYKQRFCQFSLSVAEFLMKLASDVAQVMLITYRHHLTKVLYFVYLCPWLRLDRSII